MKIVIIVVLLFNLAYSTKWALLVNGGYDKENNTCHFHRDITLIYSTLLGKGFDREHIIVCESDGYNTQDDQRLVVTTNDQQDIISSNYISTDPDFNEDGVNELTCGATVEEIRNQMIYLKNNVQLEDLLLIYLGDHGDRDDGVSYLNTWNGMNTGNYSQLNFRDDIDEITCGTIVCLFGMCYGGGFVDALQGKDNVIAMSLAPTADVGYYRYDMGHVSLPYYFFSSIRGHFSPPGEKHFVSDYNYTVVFPNATLDGPVCDNIMNNDDFVITIKEAWDYYLYCEANLLGGMNSRQKFYSSGSMTPYIVSLDIKPVIRYDNTSTYLNYFDDIQTAFQYGYFNSGEPYIDAFGETKTKTEDIILMPGTYSLPSDLISSNGVIFPNNFVISNDVTIDLNGYDIKMEAEVSSITYSPGGRYEARDLYITGYDNLKEAFGGTDNAQITGVKALTTSSNTAEGIQCDNTYGLFSTLENAVSQINSSTKANYLYMYEDNILANDVYLRNAVNVCLQSGASLDLNGHSLAINGDVGSITIENSQLLSDAYVFRRENNSIYTICPSLTVAASLLPEFTPQIIEKIPPDQTVFVDKTNNAGIQNDKYYSSSAVFCNFVDQGPIKPTKNMILINKLRTTTESKGLNRLYSLSNGAFTKVSANNLLTPQTDAVFDDLNNVYNTKNILVFDYDGNGYDDLLLCNDFSAHCSEGCPAAPDQLYKNLNGTKLELVNSVNGYQDPPFSIGGSDTRAAAWADINGNGRCELILANANDDGVGGSVGRLRVYSYNGSDQFTDITSSVIADNFVAYALRIENVIGNGLEIWIITDDAAGGKRVLRLIKDVVDGKYHFKNQGVCVDTWVNVNGVFAYDFDMADVDNDGQMELLAWNMIWDYSSITETFLPMFGLEELSTCGMIMGCKFFNLDDDNNNLPDIYFTTSKGVDLIYQNKSTATNIQYDLYTFMSTGWGQASGIAIGLDYENDGHDRMDVFKCDFSAQHGNKILKNEWPGTAIFKIALRGKYDAYGAGYSNVGGIGGKVYAYQSGHLGDPDYIIGASTINNCQSGNIGYYQPYATFKFADSINCDVKAVFPSGKITCLIDVPPGQYVIEEEGPTSHYVSVGSAVDYSTGTLSVNSAKKEIFGFNTLWLTGNRGRGDSIIINGVGYTIDSVTSETRLVLTSYPTQTFSGSYVIKRKYPTFQAWASQCRNLVSAQESEVAILYNDGSEHIAQGIGTWDGSCTWTTSADYRLTITAGNKHNGVQGSGVVLNCNANAWNLYPSYVTIENLDIRNTGGYGIYVGGDYTTIRNCIIRDGIRGPYIEYNNNHDSLYNNTIYNMSAEGIKSDCGQTYNPPFIANNTVFNCDSAGIRVESGNNVVVNNICYGNNPDFAENWSNALGIDDIRNISGDGSITQVTGSSDNFANVTLTQLAFANPSTNSPNLHIGPNSIARDAGLDLSQKFKKDIDDSVRTVPWDIGADEYKDGEIPQPPSANMRYVSIGSASNYAEGTITVTLGSRMVTGTGTTWLTSNRGKGDSIVINSSAGYTVDSVLSNGSLLLTTYPTTSYAGTDYYIKRRYSTFDAWENQNRNLVSADQSEIAILYKDGTGIYPKKTIGDWTTDAGHRLTITAAPNNRHTGIAGIGVTINCNADAWNIYTSYTTIDNLEIKNTNSYGVYLAGSYSCVRNCVLHDGAKGVTVVYNTRHDSVYNNFVFNMSQGGIESGCGQTYDPPVIVNNTVYNCGGAGIRLESGPNVLINNLCIQNNPDFAVNYANAIQADDTNNISSDASIIALGSPTKNIGNVTLAQAAFVSTTTGSENLHIQTSSYAKNAGADLSSMFVADIDGGTRVNWDIGADGYGIGTAKGAKEQQALTEQYPTVFALYPNMPNPFNPTTTIKYDIPHRTGLQNSHFTRLEIYNIRGQLVRTLVNEVRKPGYYSAIWDGRSDMGKGIASGVYIYRITAGNYVKERKMLLVK